MSFNSLQIDRFCYPRTHIFDTLPLSIPTHSSHKELSPDVKMWINCETFSIGQHLALGNIASCTILTRRNKLFIKTCEIQQCNATYFTIGAYYKYAEITLKQPDRCYIIVFNTVQCCKYIILGN